VPAAAALLLAQACAAPAGGERALAAAAPDPSAAPRDFGDWWQRQREREARDRFWNGPRERRRYLTQDNHEFWERQRDRRLGRPPYPF
jgi:hypothetical protein